MEVEKRSSKGGFLQLFDWNAKSRKKLFSNKSDVSEGSKQGKENLENVIMSRQQQMKLHENATGPSLRGSDYASSVNNDEGYGIKAPGVVARLMGLDSLPTSDVSEPCFTPVFETHSFRDSHLSRLTTDFQCEYHDIDYGVRNKLDGFSRNPVEARLQKLQNRPIQRFQSEILPPKSAKSVPITHHRLLSPIKSPGFILTRNAAYIMEAAAKIIEQSPHSTIKGKMPSVGSNSVPLRIRDLKEKMEAAHKVSNSRLPETSQRPKEHSSVKYLKAQPRDRGSEFSVSKQGGSGSLKNKDKQVSLSVQAKVNLQKRDGAASRGNRNLMNQKEDVDGKSGGHFDKKQKNTPRSVQQNRTSTGRTGTDVLRQNNQKQNCGSNKGGRASLKPRVSYQQDSKAVSTNGSFRESNTSTKVVENSAIGSKKIIPVAGETGKDLSSAKTKKFSGKKRSVNGDIDFDGSSSDTVVVKEKERSVKCNITIDGCTKWDSVDRKNGMDVVSFTFTSPIKKPFPGPQSAVAKSRSLCLDPRDDQTDSKNSTLLSLGLNVIGGDALSVLLEQKLKELTCKVESSHGNMDKGASSPTSPSTLPDLVQSCSTINTRSTENEKKAVQKWQGMEEIEGHNSLSKNSDYGKELDSQDPSTISSQEPSFSDGSCITSDSKTSFTSNGSKQYLSAEAHETFCDISAKRLELLEREMELSDSASSVSVGGMGRDDITSSSGWYVSITRSSHWELEYVKYVLSNAEMMFEEFALGQAPKVIIPLDLFDQLEDQKPMSDKNSEEYFKLERKVWFECVSECLETKCERHFSGSRKAWIKWTKFSERKELLAEELHKEISGWTSMGDLMVDELVDKDMSNQYGKWVDFEVEAFEEGVAIENGILASLIDEFVADLLLFD